MKTDKGLQVKTTRLAERAIEDACKILLEEGGISEVLKFLAIMAHGALLPAPVILRLKQQAAKIGNRRVRHRAVRSA